MTPAFFNATTAGEVNAMVTSGFLDTNPLTRGFQSLGVSFSAKHFNLRRAAVFMTKCAQRVNQNMDRRAIGKATVQNTYVPCRRQNHARERH
jgi:hypothetical protein